MSPDSDAWSLRRRLADLTTDSFGEFATLTLVERYNLPDTLQVTGHVEQLGAFISPGLGCTLADEAGGRRFSGQLSTIQRASDNTCTLTWTGDLGPVWSRFCYPNPTQAITAQTSDTDMRTGPAETVLLAFINANAGPGALTGRRVAGLSIPTSAGRGATIKTTARLDVLGTLVAGIAEAANLRISVVQSGTSLNLLVTDAPDMSATARYGSWDSGGPGLLADGWSYTLTAPTVTDAVAAGSGDLSTRVFREKIATAAESLWGLRIEDLIDESQTTDTGELDQAATDALTNGSTPVQVTATVLDSPGAVLGVDVPLGAKVQLDLAGEIVIDRLRQITTTIQVQSGSPTVSVVPVIGNADAPLTPQQQTNKQLKRALRRVIST